MENKVNIYIESVLNIKDPSMNPGFNVLNVIFFPILFFILSYICQFERAAFLN